MLFATVVFGTALVMSVHAQAFAKDADRRFRAEAVRVKSR
jgi:hypothetical protein